MVGVGVAGVWKDEHKFYKQQPRRARDLAEKADPFIKRRLLELADTTARSESPSRASIGYFRYGSTHDHSILQIFGGLLLGMLSMYIATRLYGTPQNGSHAENVRCELPAAPRFGGP
jgi:hypothetical protein